jgi:polyadenylation factor subunit 2
MLFVSFILTRTEKELAGMDDAHEGMIWDMSWHPLGHMLVSGSNDHTTSVSIVVQLEMCHMK